AALRRGSVWGGTQGFLAARPGRPPPRLPSPLLAEHGRAAFAGETSANGCGTRAGGFAIPAPSPTISWSPGGLLLERIENKGRCAATRTPASGADACVCMLAA